MCRGLRPTALRLASPSSHLGLVLLFLVEIAVVGDAQGNGTSDYLDCQALTSTITKCSPGVQPGNAFRHSLFLGIAQCVNGGRGTSVIDTCAPSYLEEAIRVEVGQLFGATYAEDTLLQEQLAEVSSCDGNISLDGMALRAPAPSTGAQPDTVSQSMAPRFLVVLSSASQVLGELAPTGALLDVSELALTDKTLDWTDILQPLRDKISIRRSYAASALPLEGAALLMVYRRDVLDAMGVQVPVTWGELLRFVEGYDEFRPAWAPSHALCAPAGASCDGSAFFSAIWHSIAQTQGLQQGVYFSPEAMRPMVDTPAFASAVNVFASLWRHALQQPGSQCSFVHPGLRLGNCSLAIGPFEQVKDVALAAAASAGSGASTNDSNGAAAASVGMAGQPGAFGVAVLPGSTYVLDPRNASRLVTCNADVCPWGEPLQRSPGPRDRELLAASGLQRRGRQLAQVLQQATVVNRVPFIPSSMLVGAVRSRASLAEQLLSWHTLSYLASPSTSRRLVLAPGSNIAPFRTSHLWESAASAWLAAGYDATLTRLGLEALKTALAHPNLGWGLHMAGGAFYGSVLSDSLARLLVAPSLAPDAVSAELRSLRAKLASYYGASPAFGVQYRDFVDLASPPAPHPTEPPSPAPSGAEGSRSTGTVVAIAVSISGSAVLLLAAYLTYRFAFAPRRSDGHRAWSSSAPAVSPTTTLLITDIEGSTKLWEELPEVVMGCALRVHHACLRRALTRHRGYESATEGDSFVLAFHDPVSALAFAIEAQQELLEQDWPVELLQTELCAPVYTCVPSGFPFKRPVTLEAMLLKIWPHSNPVAGGGSGPFPTAGGLNMVNSGTSVRIPSTGGLGRALLAHSPTPSRGRSNVSCRPTNQRASIDLGLLSSFSARSNPLAAIDTACTLPAKATTECVQGSMQQPGSLAAPLRLSNTAPGSRSSRLSGSLEPPSPRAGAVGPRVLHGANPAAGGRASPGLAAPASSEGPGALQPPTLRRPAGELSRQLQELHDQQQQQQQRQQQRRRPQQQQSLPLQQQTAQLQPPHNMQPHLHVQPPQQQQEQLSHLLAQRAEFDKRPTQESLLNSSGGWAVIRGGATAALLEDQSDDDAAAAMTTKLNAAAAAAVRGVGLSDVVSAPSAVLPTASTSRNPTGSGLIDSSPGANSGQAAHEPELSEPPSGSEPLPKIGFRGVCMGLSGGGGIGRRSRTAQGVRSGMTPAPTPHVQTPGNSRSLLLPGASVDGPYVTGGVSSWEVCTLAESLEAAIQSFEESILGERKRRLLWRGLRVRMGLHSGVMSPSEMTHNRASARTVYSGDCASVVRAVSDSAQGGMILLSEACVEVLRSLGAAGGLHGAASEALLLGIGRYRIRHKDIALSLFMAASPDLAPRVAVLPPPRNITPVGLTAYNAPVGKAAIAVLSVPDVAALREHDAEATAQALGLMECVLLEQLTIHRGYLASKDWAHGTLTAAFAFPLDALRWALGCRELLSTSAAWPTSLLTLGMCREGLLPNHLPAGGGHAASARGGGGWSGLPHVGLGSGPLPSPVSARGPTRTSLELSHALTASCDNASFWTAALGAGGGGGGSNGGGGGVAAGGTAAVRGFREDSFSEAREPFYALVAGSSQPSCRVRRAGSVVAEADGPMALAHQGSTGLSAAATASATNLGPGGSTGGSLLFATAGTGAAATSSSCITSAHGALRSGASPTWRGIASRTDGGAAVRQACGHGGSKPAVAAVLRAAESQGTLDGSSPSGPDGPGGQAQALAQPMAATTAVTGSSPPVTGMSISPAPKPSSRISVKVAALSARLRASAGGYLEGFAAVVHAGAVAPQASGCAVTVATAATRYANASDPVPRRMSREGVVTAVTAAAGATPETASSGGASPKPLAGLTVKTALTWALSDDMETEDGGDIFSTQLGGMDGCGPFGRPVGASVSGGFAALSPSVVATPLGPAGEEDRKTAVVLRGPRICVGIDCGAVDWGISSSLHCLVYGGRPAATAEKLALLAAGGQVLATFGVMLHSHQMQASLVAHAEAEAHTDTAPPAAGQDGNTGGAGGGGGGGFHSGLAGATGLRGPAVVSSALHPVPSRTTRQSTRRQQVYSCRFTPEWEEALREHDAFAAAAAASGAFIIGSFYGGSGGGMPGSSPRGGRLSPFSSPWSWSAVGRLRSKRPTPGTQQALDSRRSYSRRSLDLFSPASTPLAGRPPRPSGAAAQAHPPLGVSASGPCPSAGGAPVPVPPHHLAVSRSHPLPCISSHSGAAPPPGGAALGERVSTAASRVFASGGTPRGGRGAPQLPHQHQHSRDVQLGQAVAAGAAPAGCSASTSAPINVQPHQGPPTSGTVRPGPPRPGDSQTPQSLVACVQRWMHATLRPEQQQPQQQRRSTPPVSARGPGPGPGIGTALPASSSAASGAATGAVDPHALHACNTDESFSLSLRQGLYFNAAADRDRERDRVPAASGARWGGSTSIRSGPGARAGGLGPHGPEPFLEPFPEGALAQVPEVRELPPLLVPPQPALALSPESTFASGLTGALIPASPGGVQPPPGGVAVSGLSFGSLSTLSFRPGALAERSGPPYGSTGMASSSGGAGGGGGGGPSGINGNSGSGASDKLQLALQQHRSYARRQQQQRKRLQLATLQRPGALHPHGNSLHRRHAAELSSTAAEAIAAAEAVPQRRSDGFWRASYMSHGSVTGDGQDAWSPARDSAPSVWGSGLRNPAGFAGGLRVGGVGMSSPQAVASGRNGIAGVEVAALSQPQPPRGGRCTGVTVSAASSLRTSLSASPGAAIVAPQPSLAPSLGTLPPDRSGDAGPVPAGCWPTAVSAAAQQGYGGVFNAAAAAAAIAAAAGSGGAAAATGGPRPDECSERVATNGTINHGQHQGRQSLCTCGRKATAAAGAGGCGCGCTGAGAPSGLEETAGARCPNNDVGPDGNVQQQQQQQQQQQHTGIQQEWRQQLLFLGVHGREQEQDGAGAADGGDQNDEGADEPALQNTFLEGRADELAGPAMVAASGRGRSAEDEAAAAELAGNANGDANGECAAAHQRSGNTAVAAALDTADTDFSGMFECRCRRIPTEDSGGIKPLGSGGWASDSGGFAARTARGSPPVSPQGEGAGGASGGGGGGGGSNLEARRQRIPTMQPSGTPLPRDAAAGGSPYTGAGVYVAAAVTGGLPRAYSDGRTPQRHSATLYSAAAVAAQRCALPAPLCGPTAPELDSLDNSGFSEELDDSRASVRPPAGWRPGVHPPPQVRSYVFTSTAGVAAVGRAAGFEPTWGLPRVSSSANRSDGTSAYGQVASASGWVADSGGVGRMAGPGRAAGFGRISSSACTLSLGRLHSACHYLDELEMWRDESYGETALGRCDGVRPG